MKQKNIILSIRKAACLLAEQTNHSQISRIPSQKDTLPSLFELKRIMSTLKSIFFPAYLSDFNLHNELLQSHLEIEIEKIYITLTEQIKKGFCYECKLTQCSSEKCNQCEEKALQCAHDFIKSLPSIKETLTKDVIAAYHGDPAAQSYAEIIFCYPSINTLIHHRVAHKLFKLGVPLIPRIINEMAHAENGIDIHPQAQIGDSFTIDHGTGVVIGQTSIIGNNVKIYQGVTLGAKSFPLDKNGCPVKGIDRHPIVEDNVVIYANATILGRITIGANSTIGANMWITKNIAPNTKIFHKQNCESQ
jgi:serine O-acetyltransferase